MFLILQMPANPLLYPIPWLWIFQELREWYLRLSMPSSGFSLFRANVGGGGLLKFTHFQHSRYCFHVDGWNGGLIIDFRSMRVKAER